MKASGGISASLNSPEASSSLSSLVKYTIDHPDVCTLVLADFEIFSRWISEELLSGFKTNVNITPITTTVANIRVIIISRFFIVLLCLC